jgi:hypothetical protein
MNLMEADKSQALLVIKKDRLRESHTYKLLIKMFLGVVKIVKPPKVR